MNISLRDIKYVLTIAEEASLTRASQVLLIAQPSLSQALKRIEHEAGAKLFTRGPKQMQLTREGELFVNTGREILSAIKTVKDKIGQSVRSTSNTVLLGMTFFMGSYFFPKIVAALQSNHPDAVIHLIEKNSLELEEKLLNGEVDLALLASPLVNEALASQLLYSTPMLLIMSKEDPLNKFAYYREGEPIPYMDIYFTNHRDFLVGAQGQRVRLLNEVIFRKAGISPNMVFCSQSLATIIRVTAAGGGISIVPEFYLEWLGGKEHVYCYNLEPEYSVRWELRAAHTGCQPITPLVQETICIIVELFKSVVSTEKNTLQIRTVR